MKNLSNRVLALAAFAMLALLGLAVLSVLQGDHDALLVGLIGAVAVGLGLTIRQAQVAQAAQLKRVATKVDEFAEMAKGIPRLEETNASSPRMLDGSQERQLAETAARFDWLARRHLEQAEHLDGFLAELEATFVQHQRGVVAELHPTSDGADLVGCAQAGDARATVGSLS